MNSTSPGAGYTGPKGAVPPVQDEGDGHDRALRTGSGRAVAGDVHDLGVEEDQRAEPGTNRGGGNGTEAKPSSISAPWMTTRRTRLLATRL